MKDAPKPLNRAAQRPYPKPAFGNPVATLMDSGVGNCFPGLEFDLRQLDVRFFPGLVFEFPGVTPAGPDGTQGARLLYIDPDNDPMLDGDEPWVAELAAAFAGDAGAALGEGAWYLHWVEQYGRRIEMYDFDLYQNAVTRVPYEGETCWWIIRVIEADPDPRVADLAVALTRRDASGSPTGAPVILRGKRRKYLDDDGVIAEVYQPGDLTASMCSPWTHDFRDCACQYWASNHPDIALGPATGETDPDGTSATDPLQPLSFLDWMRRRDLPSRDVTAAPTIGGARPRRYDPYEFNLRWEELDFVLQGQETEGTPEGEDPSFARAYKSIGEAIEDLSENLAPLEMTLSLEYLYGYFSLRAPDEVTEEEARRWPDLPNDLRAARQLILSVALSEMTHMRWTNQLLWMLARAGFYPDGKRYEPVVRPSDAVPATDRKRKLRPATMAVLEEYVEIERPSGKIDTEYTGLVRFLRKHGADYPEGLFELAVRIDADGLAHYHKFRDMVEILGRYRADPPIFLRDMVPATPDQAEQALTHLKGVVSAVTRGYDAEFADDMPTARAALIEARERMHDLRDEAERLARRGLGVPFFAAWETPHA